VNIEVTATIPTMIPSVVRAERIKLVRIALPAIQKPSTSSRRNARIFRAGRAV
jgi:hypothetical protein